MVEDIVKGMKVQTTNHGGMIMQKQLLLMALGIFAVVLCLSGAAHADVWIKDPITGCEMWSGDDGSAKEVPDPDRHVHRGQGRGLRPCTGVK